MNPRRTSDSSWLNPPGDQVGLESYLETIRERIWLIVAIVAVTTGIAIFYVAVADRTYEAEADLLITPASSSNPVNGSLGLILNSSDPTRDIETASRLITNPEVASMVIEDLSLQDQDPQDVLRQIEAQPVAQSSIVSVEATADSPEEAKQLADSFAENTVQFRTQQMHAEIDKQLPRLRAEAIANPQVETGEFTLESQIVQLQYLRAGPDPTMRVETEATLPNSAASPRTTLSIAAGLFAGLILGIAAAFLSQTLDPRLRRESQLRRLYRLPILGRIPKEAGKHEYPLDPRSLSPVTAEAYRSLRTTVLGSTELGSGAPGQVIFVTGSAPSEGKTTTALNLATSIAVSGRRVIVIESDLRRPVMSKALGIAPEDGGVVNVLLENTTLQQSLVSMTTYGPSLKLLLADYEGGWITELFSIPTAREMLEEARRIADVVIIDSPPLNEVVDALPLAQLSDEVLLVARIGHTRLDRLTRLGELLAENGIQPVGFAVVGTQRPRRSEYQYYGDANRTPKRELRRTGGTSTNRGDHSDEDSPQPRPSTKSKRPGT